jgi:hypothetical protein
MSDFPNIQEDFVVVAADMAYVGRVMTEQALMKRWISSAVVFEPLDGWSFDQGARWRLRLPVLGNIVEANYVVFERREGLILWSYDGFWEGFDAWHWLPQGEGKTLIQNRLEYRLKLPIIDRIWPATIGPLMAWDADVQMQRLKKVCEDQQVLQAEEV